VRVDGPRADGMELAIGWRFTDTGEVWTLRVEHAAVSYWPALDDDIDATIVLTRGALDDVLTNPASMGDKMASGDLVIEGDAGKLAEFFGLLDQPEPSFNIIEP